MNFGKAFSAARDAFRTILPRLISIAHQLWLEVIGFVFLVLAVLFVFGPFGFIQAYRQEPENMLRLVVSGAGALMWAWFGFDSFRRAKKTTRNR